jgi:hypothetical protein
MIELGLCTMSEVGLFGLYDYHVLEKWHMDARTACYMIHIWLVVIVVPGDSNTSTTAGGSSGDNDKI